jgi:Asp-tRNA(Asn)/Glu-tRNA(Gln) amidotransferase A subunit family amidase
MKKEDNNVNITRRNLLKAGSAALLTTQVPNLMAASFKQTKSSELAWTPGWKLRELIANKSLSPVELTSYFLERIGRVDPAINSYVTVDAEGAMAQAKIAEDMVMKGKPLGPLHGLPLSIKDLIETRGLRTTHGSEIFKNYIPDRDEVQVERLRAAGAIILGKTNSPEFGKFPRTKSSVAGETFNPWNLNRISGASSGGSGAAVAAGISAMGVGSDGGGSTRIPSCYNGVFGLQPSAGRVPMRTPRSVNTTSSGPVTLHVRDAATIIQVMSGYHPMDPSSIEQPAPDFLGERDKGIAGYKIAWSRDLGVVPIVDARVVDAIENSVTRFAEVGATVDAPNIVFPDEKAFEVFKVVNQTSNRVGEILLNYTPQEQEKLTPPLKNILDMARESTITEQDEILMLENRADVLSWAESIFASYDLICTPTLGIIAPEVPAGEWDQPYTDPFYAARISTCYTYLANILGLPAASVPCGFVDGMPIGMQIIGPRFADVKVMRAAQAFSVIQPWMDYHPKLAL